ncbi:MAG: FHA domain-containing protein [Gemmatimonadetes bacterium]|nr:FHA domain-containing protein [Gemmatimonadota bacterium]
MTRRRNVRSVLAGGATFLLTGLGSPAAAATLSGVMEPATAGDAETQVTFGYVDDRGDPFLLRAGEIEVRVDGEVVPARLTKSGPGGEPWELAIALDGRAFAGEDAAAWARELASILDSAGEGETFRVVGLGRAGDLARSGAQEKELEKFLRSDRKVALWDEVTEALDPLSRPGPPARKVLLLISGGEEGKPGRFPVASVADAADSARVAVWTVSPADAGTAGGRARVASLSERTGGRSRVASPGRGPEALRAAVAGIRASQVVVLPRTAGGARIELRPAAAGADALSGWSRARRRIRPAGGLPGWVLPAAVLVLLLAAGAVALRKTPVGRLVPPPEHGDAVPVTRAGLTIGGATGNGLVLDDPRVSRNHAVVRMEGRSVVLVDLKSSNGTELNGRAITRAELSPGDRIVLAGAVELRFERFRFGKGS